MGSLTSRPKVPQARQQPVFIATPAPAASQPSAPAPSEENKPDIPSSAETAPEGAGNEEAQRLAREDNLLRRSRGRLGTVLTGFGGILSQTAQSAGRKTLLGE